MSQRRARSLTLLAASALTLAATFGSAGAARAEGCPNAAVRAEQGVQEGAVHALPDCRAYELASPPLKNEQEVNVPDRFVREVSFQAAEQGGGVQFTLTGAIPGSASGGLYGAAVATSPEPAKSWETLPLEPDNADGAVHGHGEVSGEFESFSAQLGCGVEATRLPLPPFNGQKSEETPQLGEGEKAEEAISNLYEWNPPDEYTLITSLRPGDPGATAEGPAYYIDGTSSDCGTVLFSAPQPGYSLPGSPEFSMYEWNEGSSAAACREQPTSCRPRVASVLPDGTDATRVVDPEGGEHQSDLGAISASGRRIFFTAASDAGEPDEAPDGGAQQIYLREDGTTVGAVSLSQTPSAVRDTGAKFEAASREGERVFFTANYGLTGADGKSGPTSCILVTVNKENDEDNGAGTGCDLYEYDVLDGKLSDLSADASDPNGADVRGLLGISEDGSVAYFSATGQLVPAKGNTAAQDEATSGEAFDKKPKTEAEANVYAYYDGSLHYVTTIGEAEAGGFNKGENPFVEVDAISGTKGMHYYESRVSGNGHYLLFSTAEQIGSYDNHQGGTGPLESEQYEYSLGSGAVSCVSCNPSGEAPAADSYEPFSPQGIFVAVQDGVIPRNVSEDGRVFFDSYQPLAASAGPSTFTPTDKTVNVYEWAPAGVAGCALPQGCLGLLSSGTDPFPSYFEGASADGANVYLTTHSALAPQDKDGLVDIYDVRLDGGIPLPPETPGCSQELLSCQPAQPGLGGSSSSSESGSGGGNLPNPAPPPPAPKVGTGAVKAYSARKVRGSSVTVTVSAPAKGTVAAYGGGFQTLKRKIASPTTAKVRVALSKSEQKLLARRHKLKLTLHVSFTPTSGKGSATTVVVTFT